MKKFVLTGAVALLGACLAVVALPAECLAGSFSAFGPKDYRGTTSKPKTATENFSVLNPDTSYTLHVFNGGKSNQFKRRVSSAVISLAGAEVVKPNKLNQRAAHVEEPVNLSAVNALAVELRGGPNSGLTIEVVGVDNDPPTIVASLTPAPNASGWNNTDTMVHFTCWDATSGIASCPGDVLLQQEGAAQVISGTATDNAGNTASTSVAVNIDKTPPTIVASSTPSPNAAGWNNADVTVAFVCGDLLSGIEVCPLPVQVTDEGGNQQVQGEARDQAGNTAAASAFVSLDKTPPFVTVTEPSGVVEDSPVTIRGTASDACSGIAHVACAGTAAAWSAGEFTCAVAVPDGPNAIVVEAGDLAGNVGTATATFTANLAALELTYVDDFDMVAIWEHFPGGGDPYFRPRGIPAGHYSLGDSFGDLGAGVPPSFTLVARELKPGALAAPDHYEKVYEVDPCTWGSCTQSVVYRPIPPPGYVCLGVIVKDRSLWGEHMSPQPDDMRCVRQDLTTGGRLGARLNPGAYGRYDETAWSVFPADSDGIFTGQFAWSDSSAAPPSGTLRVISAHAVRTPHRSTADVVDLIESFGPTIQLHPGEYFFPDDPQWILDNSTLEWGTVQNEWSYDSFALNVLGQVPTSASTLVDDAAYAQSFNNPPDPSFRTWIKIPEPSSGAPHSPASGDVIRGNLSRARVLVRARTYNTVFTEIQFWLFYPFNGPGRFHVDFGALWNDHEQMDTCGRHYGDWEHVSVLFESGLPVSMFLSRHDANVWVPRKDFGFVWDWGVHPVIYAGKFSHAHYRSTGYIHYKNVKHSCYWYLGGTCLDVDLEDYTAAGATLQTYDPAKYWFASSAIPGVDPPDPEPDWLQFPGRWGQYERLSYKYIVPIALGETYEYTQKEVGAGPSGPAMKGSWQDGDWCVFSDTCP